MGQDGMDGSGAASKAALWLTVALVALGGVAFFGYRVYRSREASAPAPAPASTPVPAPQPEAQAAEPAPLPPVAQADALVREKLAGASSDPLWARWLGVEDLARRFASAVNAVADGESPRLSLGFLAPSGEFQVVTRQDRSFVDPASFRRYDALADAFASLDAQAVARGWRTLEPLFEAAYREIGRPKTTLGERLGTAAALLRAAPVLDEKAEVEVVSPRALWEFADPALEKQSAAAKHLLRMGPRNQRLVQAKLAELQQALGLPSPAAAPAPRPLPDR